MPKRTSDIADLEQGTSKSQAVGQETARPGQIDDEMGEFEDQWEDEIESEEEIEEIERDAGEDEDGEADIEFHPAPEDEEEEETEKPLETYLPGVKLAEGEQLVPDQSVYLALHSLSYAWPCLSFDILRANLGEDRSTYPHTAWIVSGTQAGEIPGQGKAKDEVVVMRLSGLSKTQYDDDSEAGGDDDDDNDGEDEDAKLDFLTIPHVGNVNRIRAAPSGGASTAVPDPYHVATFSETGKVHVFDVKSHIDTLSGPSRPLQKTPVHTISNHGRSEGFAIEWGTTGLLTGDVDRKIFLTTVTPTGFHTSPNPYLSHTSSVEDLQWSPNESTVFASCSADRTVRVWDIRAKGGKSVVSVEAHEEDVNVISWNKGVDYLLLSGGDPGGLKVWDLRMFKEKPSPVAHFSWHTAPITSVEWHSSDNSVFAASGADDQVTLWDLSVEQDEDEAPIVADATAKTNGNGNGSTPDVPPQLLFVHQGQKDVKELHWHPQIPGMLLTTASDSFNAFKTISV